VALLFNWSCLAFWPKAVLKAVAERKREKELSSPTSLTKRTSKHLGIRGAEEGEMK
jgi:hypothetical protein